MKHAKESKIAMLLGAAFVAGAGYNYSAGSVQAKTHHSSMGAKMDIVDTAVGAGQFKTLAAALKAAGLVQTLKGKGPFTVFAPTDAAFAKLPKGTVQALLKDKAKLQSILLYHVVPGRLPASKVVNTKYVFPV